MPDERLPDLDRDGIPRHCCSLNARARPEFVSNPSDSKKKDTRWVSFFFWRSGRDYPLAAQTVHRTVCCQTPRR